MDRLRSELLRGIEKGLAAENIEFRRRRPGLRVVLEGKIIHVWFGYYLDQRWWRITCGWGSDHPAFTQSMNKFAELSCGIEEINDQTGVHLAHLLRDPEDHIWPMFEHEQTYPSYAWSVRGWEAYQANQRICEERAARRNAFDPSKPGKFIACIDTALLERRFLPVQKMRGAND